MSVLLVCLLFILIYTFSVLRMLYLCLLKVTNKFVIVVLYTCRTFSYSYYKLLLLQFADCFKAKTTAKFHICCCRWYKYLRNSPLSNQHVAFVVAG
jgi:hypothetical protein